jgi:hypothetical protein
MLRDSLRTGTTCRYDPNPDHPVSWATKAGAMGQQSERERGLAVLERQRANEERERAQKHDRNEDVHRRAAHLHDGAAECHEAAAELFDTVDGP